MSLEKNQIKCLDKSNKFEIYRSNKQPFYSKANFTVEFLSLQMFIFPRIQAQFRSHFNILQQTIMEKSNTIRQQPLILQKLREVVLNRQRASRDELINESRKIFNKTEEPSIVSANHEETNEIEEEEFSAPVDELDQRLERPVFFKGGMKDKTKARKPQTNHVLYAKRFQVPGWLLSIPVDFKQYLVTLKPEGKRALLFINVCKVISRSKNGHTLHTFHTEFAGKSPMTTILEAIFNERTLTYYVMDLIQWKGTYFTAESALFRYHWLVSNLPALTQPNEQCEFRLQRIELLPNTRKNVQFLYESKTSFQKDGLTFIHPDSKYLHRSNDSVMCWKDFRVSEYPIDTEDDGHTVSPEIKGVGVLAKNGGLYTLDRYRLWQFTETETMYSSHGDCIRFGFTSIAVFGNETAMKEEQAAQTEQLNIRLEGFRIISKGGYRKSVPDSLSKLMYQYKARYNPITINEILAHLE